MRSNHEIVRAHYAASDRQDIAGMLADFAPDASWTESAGFPCAGTYIGPDQVVEHVFKVLGTEWENYRFTLETLFDAGDVQIAIGTYSGTYRATGKSMHTRVAHVWQLEGGKIRKFEQFVDSLLVRRAMS